MSAHNILVEIRDAGLFNAVQDDPEATVQGSATTPPNVLASWWDMQRDGGCVPMNAENGTSQEVATANVAAIQTFLDAWDREGKAAWLFPAQGYAINSQIITPNNVAGMIQCLGGEGWTAAENAYNASGDLRGGPASRLIWNGPVGPGSGPMIRYRSQGMQIKGALSLWGHWDPTSRANLQNNDYTDSVYNDYCEIGLLMEGLTGGTPPIGFSSAAIGMGKLHIDNLTVSNFRRGVQFGEDAAQNHADNTTINRFTGHYCETMADLVNNQSVNIVFNYVRGFVTRNIFAWRQGGAVTAQFVEIFNKTVGAPATRLIWVPYGPLPPDSRNYNLRGDWDPAAGLPGGGTAQTYDAWRVSTTGVSLGGETWFEDDWLIAKVDDASTDAGAFASNWVRRKANSTISSTSASFSVGMVKVDGGSLDCRLLDMDGPGQLTVDIGGCVSQGNSLDEKIAVVRGGTMLHLHDIHTQVASGLIPLSVEMHSDAAWGKPTVHYSDFRVPSGSDMADAIHADSTGNGTLRWSGCANHNGNLLTDGWVEMTSGVVGEKKDLGDLFGGTIVPVLAGMGTTLANIAANDTAAESLLTATPADHTLPAGYIQARNTIRLEAHGYYTANPAATDITLAFGLNSITLRTLTIAAADVPITAASLWRVRVDLHCRTAGASGTAACLIVCDLYDATAKQFKSFFASSGGTVAIDTTIANTVQLTAAFASTANSPNLTTHGHVLTKTGTPG